MVHRCARPSRHERWHTSPRGRGRRGRSGTMGAAGHQLHAWERPGINRSFACYLEWSLHRSMESTCDHGSAPRDLGVSQGGRLVGHLPGCASRLSLSPVYGIPERNLHVALAGPGDRSSGRNVDCGRGGDKCLVRCLRLCTVTCEAESEQLTQ